MRQAAVTVSFLTPLALAPHLLFYYDVTPKIVVLLLGAAVVFALAAFHLDSLRSFCGTALGKGFTSCLAVTAVATFLSAGLSTDAPLAWNGSNWRRYGAVVQIAVLLAAWLMAASTRGIEGRILPILLAVCAAGTLASLYGILQYFGWDPFLSSTGYEAGQGPFRIVRPPGPLGHSDYFAAFLLWPVFIGAGLGGIAPKWLWFGRVSAATGALAILLSGSRGALLALAVGTVIFLLGARPVLRTWGTLSLVTALLLTAFYLSPPGTRLRARAHWIGEDPAGGARLMLWKDSIRMSLARPLLGYGPDAFVAEFPRYESVDLARAYPDFYHESPHNLWLDTLTGQGIVALLGQCCTVLCALLAGVRAMRIRPGMAVPLLSGFAAAVTAHQFSVLTAPNAFYLYLGGALLVALTADSRMFPESRIRWGVMAVGCAAGLFLVLTAFRIVSTDLVLGAALRRIDAGDIRGAADAYRRAFELRGSGVQADLFFSRRWARASAATQDVISKVYLSQLASGAANLATQDAEGRQNAWYNVAELAASRDDPASAARALQSASEASPNWYKPHWAMARLLFLMGRKADAAPEARRALELNGGKDPEVAATMEQIFRSTEARR